ncbi:SPFH domain-containing protein [Caviibacter abscessus]|uniref:SPFH domain-containing protein n=1 Tax=Caviibacter abscessus TaxID=1766719 RepID=UPI0008378957|nr:SPFH domain-containing protein [Caviibacter abscessus]
MFLPSLIIIVFGILISLIINGIKIVPESKVFIVQRLGKYHVQLNAGFHIINPFLDNVIKKVSLKETVKDFDPQPVITKDNATMLIDTVVYFQITAPKLYTYGVENPILAIENLTATTLRNIIGDLTVDQTLTSRDTINSKMRMELDEATDPWGIKVNRVELKSILPPEEIREAMEKEMKAERVKRATVLEAQATKEAAILIAEGEKTAAILKAEAEKEVRIKEAEGQARAILELKKAEADGIKLLNENVPEDKILRLQALKTLTEVADGKATKIIIPSEIQSLAGLVTSFKEL